MTDAELIRKAIPDATQVQAERFETYMAMLADWNSRMNLTAITEPEEVVTKHFADSILPSDMIPANAHLIDVGTGAGFPGIPLLIMREDIKLTLLDSLNKRIMFLDEVISALGITARTVHMRAEDAGRSPEFRGKFDVAVSRALANASAAMEWTVPLLKIGGVSMMYKGPKADEELAEAGRAVKLLDCEAHVDVYDVPWGERRIIMAKKKAQTPDAYPRKAGTAAKKPL